MLLVRRRSIFRRFSAPLHGDSRGVSETMHASSRIYSLPPLFFRCSPLPSLMARLLRPPRSAVAWLIALEGVSGSGLSCRFHPAAARTSRQRALCDFALRPPRGGAGDRSPLSPARWGRVQPTPLPTAVLGSRTAPGAGPVRGLLLHCLTGRRSPTRAFFSPILGRLRDN